MDTQKKKISKTRTVRFPIELWETIAKAAEDNERSINKQIVFIVKTWLKKNRYLKS